MRRFALALLFAAIALPLRAQQTLPPSTSAPSTSAPTSFVTNGLVSDYQMNVGDTVASLKDYAGSNNATGTVGTAPTITAVTGGLNCTGNGAVILPAALNSALTVEAFVSYQTSGNTNSINAVVFGNGNGAASNANGLALSTAAVAGIGTGGGRLVSYGGSTQQYAQFAVGNGNISLIWTMAATDHLYMNGKEELANGGQGASVGLQTTGAYQICGAAAGSGLASQTYFTGTIVRLRFFSRAITAAEAAQDALALQQAAQSRGYPSFQFATDQNDQISVLGDSIACGQGVTPWSREFTFLNGVPLINATYANAISAGATNTQCIIASTYQSWQPFFDFTILPLFRPNANKNLFIAALGANDITGTNMLVPLGYLKADCLQAKQAGFKCFPMTVLSRTGNDPNHDVLNGLIRNNWQNFADGLIDVAADPVLGADGASTNATWFSDGLHPTLAGQQRMALDISHGINRAYANSTGAGNATVAAGTGISTPYFVQSVTQSSSGTSHAFPAFPNNVAAGDAIVCVFLWNGAGITITGVADAESSTYAAVAAAGTVQANTFVQAWLAPNATGGTTNVITPTFSGSTAFFLGNCSTYRNVLAAAPTDVASAVATGSSASPATANVTTTVNGDILIGYFGSIGGANLTPGTNYVLNSTAVSTQAAEQSEVSGTAGSYSATGTLSASEAWAIGVVALKPIAGTTSTYVMQDGDIFSYCNTTTSSMNMILPPAIGLTGQTVTIKNNSTGANTCTITGGPEPGGTTDTIDGNATTTIANGATLILQSTLTSPSAGGASWKKLQNN